MHLFGLEKIDVVSDGDRNPDLLSFGAQVDAIPITIDNQRAAQGVLRGVASMWSSTGSCSEVPSAAVHSITGSR